MTEKIIMTAGDIRRTLIRIAHEVIERNHAPDELVLVGVHTRGVPLARRMASIIENFEESPVPVGAIDISLHRDDLPLTEAQPAVRTSDIPIRIDGKSVVLVDDVLYTGRSIRAAIDALIEFGRPKSIQLAVLIDRGHREMPIRPDFVGKNVPTSHLEEIQVRLTETDTTDEVAIISLPTDSESAQVKGGYHAGQ